MLPEIYGENLEKTKHRGYIKRNCHGIELKNLGQMRESSD